MQTGPKLVDSVEHRKALEFMAIVEEKWPIAQRDGRESIPLQFQISSKKALLKGSHHE